MKKSTLNEYIKILICIIITVALLPINAFSDEVSQNQQLAQYYAVLAQQGGNESVSKEDAIKLAQYYALLSSGTSAPQTSPQQAVQVQTGTTLTVNNINASLDYYNTVVSVLNGMPEYLKQRLSSNNTVFNLYNKPQNFGESYNVGGITHSSMIYGYDGIDYSFSINLAEHSSIKDKAFVIYHEVGHAVNYLLIEKYDMRGDSMAAFDYAVQLEGWTSRNLAGYTNVSNYYDEFFADGFAEYYLKTAKFKKKCPNMFNFFNSLMY